MLTEGNGFLTDDEMIFGYFIYVQQIHQKRPMNP